MATVAQQRQRKLGLSHPEPAPRTPRRPRRRWRWLLLPAMLAVLLWLLPGLVAHSFLFRWILSAATADLKGSVIAAERLRAAVGREPLPEVRGRRHLSCTLGVAEHRKGENTRLVLGRAEAALNYAKAAGRDRVVALDTDGKPLLIKEA